MRGLSRHRQVTGGPFEAQVQGVRQWYTRLAWDQPTSGGRPGEKSAGGVTRSPDLATGTPTTWHSSLSCACGSAESWAAVATSPLPAQAVAPGAGAPQTAQVGIGCRQTPH